MYPCIFYQVYVYILVYYVYVCISVQLYIHNFIILCLLTLVDQNLLTSIDNASAEDKSPWPRLVFFFAISDVSLLVYTCQTCLRPDT